MSSSKKTHRGRQTKKGGNQKKKRGSEPAAVTIFLPASDSDNPVICKLRIDGKRLFVNDTELLYQDTLSNITREESESAGFPWDGGYGRFAYMMQGENCMSYGFSYPEEVASLDTRLLEVVDCFAWLLLEGHDVPSAQAFHYEGDEEIRYGDSNLLPFYLPPDDKRSRRIHSRLEECKFICAKARLLDHGTRKKRKG